AMHDSMVRMPQVSMCRRGLVGLASAPETEVTGAGRGRNRSSHGEDPGTRAAAERGIDPGATAHQRRRNLGSAIPTETNKIAGARDAERARRISAALIVEIYP